MVCLGLVGFSLKLVPSKGTEHANRVQAYMHKENANVDYRTPYDASDLVLKDT